MRTNEEGRAVRGPDKAPRRPREVGPLHDRFLARVLVLGNDQCWVWQGRRHKFGYGIFAPSKRTGLLLAHRLSWMLFKGDPGGLCVLHQCDNPPCVNPGHLFLGTKADNTADMMAKNRGRGQLTKGQILIPAKLSPEDVKEARRRVSSGESYSSVARSLGVVMKTVWFACRGQTHASVPGDVIAESRVCRLTPEQTADICRCVAAGESQRSVAKRMGIARVTVRRAVRRGGSFSLDLA